MNAAVRRVAAAALLVLLGSLAAVAAETREIVVPLMPGETLEAIAARRLEPGHDGRDLARYNDYENPRRLRAGQPVRIPYAWLRLAPVAATISARRGEARIEHGEQQPASEIGEGARIETGEHGVVELELPDGTRLTVHPASAIRIERLRRYYRSDAIDARIRIDRGRIEAETPPSADQDAQRRIEVRSPKATAAVRGTIFRVGESSDRAVSEVLRGAVQWRGRTDTLSLAAGFGSSASRDGQVSAPEPLPAPPDLDALPRRVETTRLDIAFDPVPGASAYRVRAIEGSPEGPILVERIVDQARIAFETRVDGPLLLSARSILPSGVEGRDASRSIEVAARPPAPRAFAPADGSSHAPQAIALAWDDVAGAAAYRVQLARDPTFSRLSGEHRVGRPMLEFHRPAQAPGVSVDYYWRVASIDSRGHQGPYASAGHFTTRSAPSRPSPDPVIAIAGDARELRWHADGAASYEVELAHEAASTTILTRRVAQARLRLPTLEPGRYRIRIRAIGADGLSSAFCEPVSYSVASPVVSGSGAPIEAAGAPLLGPTD